MPPQFLHFVASSDLHDSLCDLLRDPLCCSHRQPLPFFERFSLSFLSFTKFTVVLSLSTSLACVSLSLRALPAFKRAVKSRSSRSGFCLSAFDLQLRIICSLISLSASANSQVFARVLSLVWKLSKLSPSFC